MKGALIVVLCLVVGSLAACQMTRPTPWPIYAEPYDALDVAAAQAQMQPGHATIHGQAFARTVGGDVKFAAGNKITLLPDSLYAQECIHYENDPRANTSCGDKLKPLMRQTIADGEGHFAFDHVAPGKYLVLTVLTWGVPSMYGMQQTGGLLQGTAEVTTDNGDVTVYVK